MAWVLFFDGECAFCSASVQRVFRLDRRGNIAFAPLQGELSRQHGFSHHAAQDGGSMVLWREADGRVFTHSDGCIELGNALGGVWRVLGIFKIVPKCLRDGVYRWVAANRFRFMGRADACQLPDSELAKRLRP